MSSAFVFEDETLLCQQTVSGWSPVLVDLPAVSTDHKSQPPYQLGRVQLQISLAPSYWQSADSTTADLIVMQHDAPATSAITYYYAQNHQLALPKITPLSSVDAGADDANKDAVLEANDSATTAFIPYRQLLATLSVALADQLSQAIQLLRWQADTQFCSRCSAPVKLATSGERAMVCSVCRLRQYPRVQPCVITAITRLNPVTNEMQVLLAHHHRYGQKTPSLQYGLIAGFVEVGESLEHAVVREVAEEVGIRVTDIRYVSSQPWPFPSNLMLGFRASYVSGDIVIQEDELSHAEFFDISNLPKIPFKGSIAYDLIAQIAQEQGVCL